MGSGVLPAQTVFPYQCVHVFRASHERAGERCTRRPLKGATICTSHGVTKRVREKAAERLARETALQWAAREAEAQPWLAELGSDPLAHVEALLRFEALSYATWKLACEQLVDSGDLLLWQNHKGEAAIHPYMEEMDKAAVRWDRVSKHAIDAGVSTKRLAMEEESMGLLAAAARMALAEKALGLPPEVQREALRFLGQHLRSIGPGTGP
jgi:hypothetical protein